MSNDRELLEPAAKAVGGEYREHALGGFYLAFAPDFNGYNWNPLTDDGDALRLAAKLKIDLEWQHDEDAVEAYVRSAEGSTYCPSYPASEYKRAIVDVAAHIGKAMP